MADFENWNVEHLSGPIIVLQKAVKETKESDFDDPQLFGEVLLMIRDKYVGMRRGAIAPAEYEAAAKKLRVENTDCFGEKKMAHGFPEYKIMHKGESQYMYRHFKYGSGYDNRKMFRIYYIWDEGDQSVVIGHMPSHLDNFLTN